MRRRLPGALLASSLAAALAAAPARSPAQVVGLAARVNGAEITNERLERFFESFAAERGRQLASFRNPEAYKRWKREALGVLVDEELLWQEARRKKRTLSPREVEAAVAERRSRARSNDAFQAQLRKAGLTEEGLPDFLGRQLAIERLLDREVAARQRVTRAEVRRFYAENPARFTVPEEVHARHVLVRVEPAAPEERKAEARRRIEEVQARARAGEDFAELARRHSDDATAPSGGDLGFFQRRRMVPAFEEAAFALAPGSISEVIETVYGYHLIQVLERRGGQPIPEKEVAEAIRAELLAEKSRKAVQELLEALRRAASIEILLPL